MKSCVVGMLMVVCSMYGDRALVTERETAYPVLPVILHRWAPRAFSSEPVTDTELMTLFEAARWGQSSYNNQPWRFIYARPSFYSWPTFLNLLAPANQVWAGNAQVLVVVISKKTFDYNGQFDGTHSFATGTAVQNLALQAAFMAIVVHGMAGFNYQQAQLALHIPQDYAVEAMLAIGKLGDKQNLPASLQAWELPSERKPLSELVFESMYPSN